MERENFLLGHPLHLALLVHQALQHFLGAGELVWVPGEVALAVCVLDVQPDEVVGDVVLVEAGVHRPHVFLVVVVPAALVVGQGGQGGEGLGAWRSTRGEVSVIAGYRPDPHTSSGLICILRLDSKRHVENIN